ncbi:nitroreductase [Levilactobacillus namurensis]|uniref:nitroreductase n=1 Tax=Levilactobacillus namurensis TaxID=380393 RepID=UPI00222EB4BD|nr:nitroreductase [Levilactobacillus namurensis]MCW3779121.1 nitroreductase [Levilactobacillus namurensis]MDT7019895.1 nitroreductase [Levilactobacillus namurensis]WNN65524.1 nitroreductase [Levilactobacillus namurensis]
MPSQDLLAQRHSARSFSNRPVTRDTLTAIITQAQLAPSWENTQPWKVYIATGEAATRLRQSHFQRHNQGQKSWTEVMPPKKSEWAAFPQANLDAWRSNMLGFFGSDANQFADVQKDLFNAPALVYLTMPQKSSAYSAYDLGAFGYGILLAAQEHGVSGVPAYELVRYPEEIHQEFDIPAGQAIFMGIALGYPSDSKVNALRTKRRPVTDILTLKH